MRLLWLQLLPSATRQLVAGIRVCKHSAQPPLYPLFSPISIGNISMLSSQPRGGVWVANRGQVAPAANFSFVEVTHCPVDPSANTDRRLSSRPWQKRPMWLYVAAGSGVSINVGRTKVLPSYEALGRLLSSCRFWEEPPIRAAVGPSTCQSRNRPHHKHHCPGLAEFDSVQVLRHFEYYSREPRHELVMLRLDNCAPLTAKTPGVMCGRGPNFLRRCEQTSDALARLADCQACDLCRPNSLGIQVTKGGPCASTSCYRNEHGQDTCPLSAL